MSDGNLVVMPGLDPASSETSGLIELTGCWHASMTDGFNRSDSAADQF